MSALLTSALIELIKDTPEIAHELYSLLHPSAVAELPPLAPSLITDTQPLVDQLQK